MIDRARLSHAAELIRRGRLGPAGQIVAEAVAAAPGDPDVWALAAEFELMRGDLARAVEASRKALALEPRSVLRRVQSARMLAFANRLADAKQACEAALAAGAGAPDHLTLLGSILVCCEDYERALELYRKALAHDPAFHEAKRGLVTVYRFVGRFAEAEELCDELLAVTPDDVEMVHLRSSLRTQTAERNHVEELQARLAREVPDWRVRVQLCYSLAKEFEDLGRYQESFATLEQGASLRHRNTVYDVTRDAEIFGAIKQAFSAARIDRLQGEGHSSEEPIFIVGMPRSGTTLVERIVSSHSAVFAAGELQDFATELVASATRRHGDLSQRRLDLPELALSIDFAELGENYLQATRRVTGHTPRFIDKLPLNFLYVGYIRLAFPNARIVHVRRDPMDSCYAMYKYLFKHAYPFSYDLESLGRYFAAYRNLMDFWHRIFPGEIIEIEYENLIADQEGQTRRLIGALGLDWEDACLAFHRNAAASTTGSAAQVREPIYTSSVAKWRRYEHELEPLRRVLADTGVI
ncbi:MAG: sulfotransferase [Candidatus Andeanibacterium colombiense]|uniref:Sulfotransferase n=1 Tax=Candidatus Andeanibacterium colombiense TaxID=3121345 RepID=A0AAJ5X8S7_9SPHN|nr:MAG: sulfotransferase [Sphingomonadaceae bacterium]